ncbi:hypothetical protein RHGRI_002047 [Rhododendron griersonianum]|uniref:Saccharopine dehydrogenase NADP binding domain-containing protein n=1 Tax=Rhododendron griersonianum TaxID=479676 RepID=A0AAV6LND4_9ERIC|nr:hypothetical protein RHGRI_002047 [Rhododendron griersonianum]
MARPWLHLNNSRSMAMACAKESNQHRVLLPEKVRNSRVLILGGTGRVGGSTAIALSKLCPDLRIVVGGRNKEKGAARVAELGKNSEFTEVDIEERASLEATLRGYLLDLTVIFSFVGIRKEDSCACRLCGSCSSFCGTIPTGREVHCAGSGHTDQGEKQTAYMDVCDDTSYAFRAKSYMSKALAANIPAITTGGIYPGVSNGASTLVLVRYSSNISGLLPSALEFDSQMIFMTVMAAELVRAARSESKGEPERLRFSYYTAGTGGAGPTILATSFLLLGEEVVAYSKGKKIKVKPYSGMRNIDFGKGIGKKDVYLLNLPEVRSAHEILGVPTVSARFGTAPFYWNWGMVAMTNLLPVEFLRDRSKVQKLVELFDPVVRAVDEIAGERVSMRVDLECSDGRQTLALFSHRRLSVLFEGLQPSFDNNTSWLMYTAIFNPEGIAIEAREALLKRAAEGTISFIMNKPPWMVETDPKELGLGIYL